MPKKIRQTHKYVRASELEPGIRHSSADDLYQKMQDMGYFWNPNIDQWVYSPADKAEPPLKTLKIRLWTDKNRCDFASDKIIEILSDAGFSFIEKSQIYVCRPPNNNDARVYLHFDYPEL